MAQSSGGCPVDRRYCWHAAYRGVRAELCSGTLPAVGTVPALVLNRYVRVYHLARVYRRLPYNLMRWKTPANSFQQLFASLYYCVIYLLACKLYKPIVAGSAILPLGLAIVPVSGVTGVLITRIGQYKWSIWIGWTISAIGCGLLVVLDVTTSPAAWVFIFICAGAGQGLLLIGHSVAVQASCKPQDAAHASGMYSFARSFGLCMGVVVGGTIFQNFLRMKFEQTNLPVSVAENAEGFIPVLQGLSSVTGEKLEYQRAYAWALRMLFSTLTGISAVGLLISLAIGNHTLDMALESKHVLRSGNSRDPGRSVGER